MTMLHECMTPPAQQCPTMCTYHAWFAEPAIDLQHSHWRHASCIRATNIPYSQLISLIKLRTNSHHLDIERLRQALGPQFPDPQSVSLVPRP
jgi:hypothetical protein